jgi:hypothetical protein
MQTYVIEPPTEAGKKGRSFSARCVALVVADRLCGFGGNTIRPVWAQFIGSDPELRPFMTNLKLGRKAEPAEGRRRGGDAERLEFLKGGNWQISWQREPEGTIATIYHPEIFRLDPGMVDPAGAKFIMLVPAWWVAAQGMPEGDAVAHLFAAMLDRRTRCPLVNDGAFYRQLLAAALDSDTMLAFEPDDRKPAYAHGRFVAEGLEDAGIARAIAFESTHERLETFLAEQVATFFAAKEERAA